jgi:GDP-L-fucose synthase
MSFWTGKRVIVTGGAGFLGSFVVEGLRKRGCAEIAIPRKSDFDLREKDNVDRLFRTARPDIFIHLAAVVGGIGANRRHPGLYFYENAIMGIHAIECARIHSLEKFVCVGTVCSYPKFTPVPFREDDFWNGYPEETNAPYGLAKKMLLVQLQAYRQEYGLNGIYLTPVNLYGPRDNFDLESSHVIPGLIHKYVEAKRANAPSVTAWGTGNATREFLYVEDAAEGIIAAAETYNKPDLVNLGANQEIKIRDLSQMIAELVGYKGSTEWDASQPDGQPRRRLDTSRALKEFGWQARTPLEAGLRNTIDWFQRQSEGAVRASGSV